MGKRHHMGESTWIEHRCHQENIRVKASQKFVPFLLFPKHLTTATVGYPVGYTEGITHTTGSFYGNIANIWRSSSQPARHKPAPDEMWSWEALLGACRLCRLEAVRAAAAALKSEQIIKPRKIVAWNVAAETNMRSLANRLGLGVQEIPRSEMEIAILEYFWSSRGPSTLS